MNISNSDIICRRGFLSSEIDAYRLRYREQFSSEFSACEEKSSLAVTMLFDAELSHLADGKSYHLLLGVGFWARCVRACQGAILLLERGMVPEGQTLIRTAYEFLFLGAASINDSSVIDKLISNDLTERKKQAIAILKDCGSAGTLMPEHVHSLNEFIANSKGVTGTAISTYDAAKSAGYLELHATVYRGMSMVASHATLAATNSVFQESDEGFRMVFGPSENELAFSIGLVETCLSTGMERFGPLLAKK